MIAAVGSKIQNRRFAYSMAYQVIARKWRPQKFEDVTGQEVLTQTLRNAIEHGRLHHAYLFSDPPRGWWPKHSIVTRQKDQPLLPVQPMMKLLVLPAARSPKAVPWTCWKLTRPQIPALITCAM